LKFEIDARGTRFLNTGLQVREFLEEVIKGILLVLKLGEG
jgi:hypothetical protein